MTSKNKATGTRWESAVVTYLRAWWPAIDRRPLSGKFDKGDLKYGPYDWTIECKNQAQINLPFFMRQARIEARNAGTSRYVVVIKARRSKYVSGSTGDAYAIMPLSMWAEVVRENELLREQAA